MKVRAAQFVESLGYALLLLFPITGFSLLALIQTFQGRISLDIRWLAVWSPALLFSAVGFLFTGREPGVLLLLGLLCFAPILRLRQNRRPLMVGFAFALITFTMLLSIDRVGRNAEWVAHPPSGLANRSLTAQGWSQTVSTEVSQTWMVRSWTVPAEATTAVLTFESKLRRGHPGTRWHPAGDDVQISYSELGESSVATFAHIRTNGPIAYKYYEDDRPVGGRLFRATMHIRVLDSPAMPGSDSAGIGEVCSGLWMQAAGGNYSSHCKDVHLSNTWQQVSATWRPSPSVSAKSLRLGATGLRGHQIQITNVRLEENVDGTWIMLDPLQPLGLQARLEWNDGQPGEQHIVHGLPSAPIEGRWQTYSVSSDVNAHGPSALKAVLTMEKGLLVSVRNTRLHLFDADGQKVPAETILHNERSRLWFGHANLLGHTIAAGSLVTSLMLSPPIAVASVVLGLISVFFTASRSAFWVLAVGAGLVILSRSRNTLRCALVTLSLGLLIVFSETLLGSRVSNVFDSGLNARTAIWSEVIRLLAAFPLGNHPYQTFSEFWTTTSSYITGNPASHAHNLWLEVGFQYGALGLVGIALSSLLLIGYSWRTKRWPGTIFTLSILTLNALEPALFQVSVLACLAIGLTSSTSDQSTQPHKGSRLRKKKSPGVFIRSP